MALSMARRLMPPSMNSQALQKVDNGWEECTCGHRDGGEGSSAEVPAVAKARRPQNPREIRISTQTHIHTRPPCRVYTHRPCTTTPYTTKRAQ